MKVTTQTRYEEPQWNDCSGHSGWEEYKVWVNGELIIDTFHQGGYFDSESYAIETAKDLYIGLHPKK